VWALRTQGEHELVALTDPRPELTGREVAGVPIVGGDDQLAPLRADGVEGACLGVGGTRDNSRRARLYGLARELGFELPAVVHARSVVAPDALIAAGTVVFAAAVIGPGATIGPNAIINSGAVVEHDCVLEQHVHVATSAALAGHVRIDEGAHVGLGARVLTGIQVGATSVVGAGATVVRDVPPGATVVGTPAEPISER